MHLELMTVEQYRCIPDREDVIEELHWGMVVQFPRPTMGRAKLQSRLLSLLAPKAERLGVVASAIAFRALPEYDLRAADVAIVSRERWDATDGEDNLHGSPELVIEVLSPSNTQAEMREKAVLCLSTGTQEFWVVDPKRRTISVTPRAGEPVIYTEGERIPLRMFATDVSVSEIFDC